MRRRSKKRMGYAFPRGSVGTRVLSMRLFGRLTILLALLPAALARADEAGDRFAAAAGDYRAKRWKLAAEEFQAFLDKYPAHANANQCYFFQAEALLQLGRYEAAHEKLQ